jgi:deaminated glutathione amidase
MQDISVAVAQMNSTNDYQENLQKIIHLIKDAADKKAEIILLPENFICFSAVNSLDIAKNQALDILTCLCENAKAYNIALILGSFPVKDNNDVVTQSIVINNQGKIVSRYNKIHLFKADIKDGQGSYDESKYYSAGKSIVNCELSAVNIGLSICYDLRFPELYQKLRVNGAEVLTVPAAFTHTTGKAHWLPLLQSRAIETQCFVLAANQCGWHSDTRQTWGHSCIISPWGEVLAMAGEQPELLLFTLTDTALQNARNAIPVWQNKQL